MTQPSTARSVTSVTSTEPRPVSGILRPFPSERLPQGIDPFVFLDTGAPAHWGHRTITVPPHSHRGVQPVSLLFRGEIFHRDSLGNARTVHSGGMQWLVAGSGALHEELLQADRDGVFHMAQLWINTPAERKLDPPEHHALPAEAIPELRTLGEGSLLRLYAGDIGEVHGPAPMPTKVLVAHIQLEPGGSISVPVPEHYNAMLTVVAGEIETAGREGLRPGDTPVFALDGDSVALSSASGGQVLLMCGEPIGEPVVFGGGYVMNSREEIDQAFADEAAGRMGQLEASP